MKTLTPKLAQEMTERSWGAQVRERGECGWCLWANNNCQKCPVAVVFEQKACCSACDGIPAYQTWRDAVPGKGTDAAVKIIHDLLVEYHEQLIAAAHKIREGMA